MEFSGLVIFFWLRFSLVLVPLPIMSLELSIQDELNLGKILLILVTVLYFY